MKIQETERLKNFELENATEIGEFNVSFETLIRLGVKEKTLVTESYLYDIFGDSVSSYVQTEDDNVSGMKRVEKLTDAERGSNAALLSVNDEIENNEFDNELELIRRKL
ncbi:MAG: hypothetical protein IJ538_00215 [Clostridia bacterium]|nr:hypothetical protein [Clostridia bacterium]